MNVMYGQGVAIATVRERHGRLKVRSPSPCSRHRVWDVIEIVKLHPLQCLPEGRELGQSWFKGFAGPGRTTSLRWSRLTIETPQFDLHRMMARSHLMTALHLRHCRIYLTTYRNHFHLKGRVGP